MADIGHLQTNALLRSLERALRREYKQATKEMKIKLDNYMKGFADADKQKQSLLAQGAITQKQYTDWRQGKIMGGKQYKDLLHNLSLDMLHTNQIAASMIDDRLPKAYALNHNYATYTIDKLADKAGLKINTNFTLYDKNTVKALVKDKPDLLPKPKVDIPKDLLWNRQKLNSAILQGVLQGDSIPHLADRLQSVTIMNRNSAVRNARTMMTSAQNRGRIDSYVNAKNKGIPLKKVWIATLDNVTRDRHVDLDGEIQDINKPFSNGLDYPGASGPPEEVYNCRCTMAGIIEEINEDLMDIKNRNISKMEQASYDEWKNKHKVKFGYGN